MELIEVLQAIGTPAAVIVHISFTYVLWRHYVRKVDEYDQQVNDLLRYVLEWIRNQNGRPPSPPTMP